MSKPRGQLLSEANGGMSKAQVRKHLKMARENFRNIENALRQRAPDYADMAQQAMSVQGEMAVLVAAWEEDPYA